MGLAKLSWALIFMPKNDAQPPKRKELGLIGKSISGCVQLCGWLLMSLLISCVIEWVGIAFIWPEQGEHHARDVLASDITYLNQHLHNHALTLKKDVVYYATTIKDAIPTLDTSASIPWLNHFRNKNKQPVSPRIESVHAVLTRYHKRFEPQLNATVTVTQIFIIRLALIIFALPMFIIAGLMGVVDGLVERDLRRWGGGRESSNVFNLAKRSIAPFFFLACVLYISVPVSVYPIIIILPFAVLLGLSVRISFEKLKKYF